MFALSVTISWYNSSRWKWDEVLGCKMGIKKYGRRRTWLQGKIETRRETGEEEERTKFNNSSDDTQPGYSWRLYPWKTLMMMMIHLRQQQVVLYPPLPRHHHRYINLIVVITIIVRIKPKCLFEKLDGGDTNSIRLENELRDLFADERKDRNTSISLNLVLLSTMMKQENCIKRHTDPTPWLKCAGTCFHWPILGFLIYFWISLIIWRKRKKVLLSSSLWGYYL